MVRELRSVRLQAGRRRSGKNCQLQIANCQLVLVGNLAFYSLVYCPLPIGFQLAMPANCRAFRIITALPIVHCLLPIVFLPIANCKLPIGFLIIAPLFKQLIDKIYS
jgi:hypothetical protein